MALKAIFKKIKKGATAFKMAVQQQDQALTDGRLLAIINEFKSSEKYRWMAVGQQYYEVENDILSYRPTRVVDGQAVEETYKANNRIPHAKYKIMVDEKVSYLLGRPYTLKCEDEAYIERVKLLLGSSMAYKLNLLGYYASNCGIAWLMPYIDEQGAFRTMVIPSDQCVPIWTDRIHRELGGMLRVYDTQEWQYNQHKTIHHVEYWTARGVDHYIHTGSLLTPYVSDWSPNDGPVGHYRKNGEAAAWGRVPFIPWKNNHVEMPDIKFTKHILDQYDKSRSEAANYVEEVKNLIYILKGYGGEDLQEFMRGLNEDRAIPIDDPQEGGVDALTPTMDITAIREHYEQLRRDIAEDGQSINKDIDKFGNNPSGVALKFLYAGLDLKCDAMETQFTEGFDQLLYFVNRYLEEVGNQTTTAEVEVVFSRNMKINESEAVDSCTKSQNLISKRTLLAHHPYVTDVEEELDELYQETQDERAAFDKIPLEDLMPPAGDAAADGTGGDDGNG